MKIVLGPITQLKTRQLHRFIESRSSWGSLSKLGGPEHNDLRFWADFLRKLNRKGLSLSSRAEILVPQKLLATDASAIGGGGCLGENSDFAVAVTKWSPEEAVFSSTWRELQAVLFCLRAFASRIRNKRVKLQTDNTGVVCIIAKGSPNPELQRLVESVFNVCLDLGVVLEPVWVPRENNEVADEVSRIVDLDDWAIRREVFHEIDLKYGPHTVDRFADHNNTRLPRFNSRYFVPGTECVDSFSADWKAENNWLVPPLFLVPRAIQYLRECKGVGTLVVPKWPAQPYWPLLVGRSGHFAPHIVDWFQFPPFSRLFDPSSQPSSIFNDRRFQSAVLVLKIDFSN